MQILQRRQSEAVVRRPASVERKVVVGVGFQAGADPVDRRAGLELHIGEGVRRELRRMPVLERDRRERRLGGREDVGRDVRVGGQVLQHRHHPHGVEGGHLARLVRGHARASEPDLHLQGSPDRGVLPEVLARGRAGDDQAVWRLDGGVRVPREHRIAQHPEEAGIGPEDGLLDGLVPLFQSDLRGRDAGDALQLRKVDLQRRRRRRRHAVDGEGLLSGQDESLAEAIDVLVVRQEALETVLVTQVEADQDRGGEADRQAGDGDRGIEPVAPQVPERGGDVVGQHGIRSPTVPKEPPAAASKAAAAGAGVVGGPTSLGWAFGMARRPAGSRRPPGRRAAGWCAALRRHGPGSG